MWEVLPVHIFFNLRICMSLNEIATSTHNARSELIFFSCISHHERFMFMTLEVLFIVTRAVSIALYPLHLLICFAQVLSVKFGHLTSLIENYTQLTYENIFHKL